MSKLYDIATVTPTMRQLIAREILHDEVTERRLNGCAKKLPEKLKKRIRERGQETVFEDRSGQYALMWLTNELRNPATKWDKIDRETGLPIDERLVNHGNALMELLGRKAGMEYIRELRATIENRIAEELGKMR